MSDAERRARAQARRDRVTVHKTSLSRVEPDPWPVRGAEAISLVTQLTRESWALAGLPYPNYERTQIPHRFVRGRLT